MDHKERVRRAVARRNPDRLPTQITFTPEMSGVVARHLGVAAEELPLGSPRRWREVFKLRYRRIWEVYKTSGRPVFHHSCDDIREILPDMVEIGLDVLNPVQPHAMPIEELAERHGQELSFWGGISTQVTLPFGTPEAVEDEVQRAVHLLGRHGGYIVAPSHDMTSDVSMENFDALVRALRQHPRARP